MERRYANIARVSSLTSSTPLAIQQPNRQRNCKITILETSPAMLQPVEGRKIETRPVVNLFRKW